MATLVWQRPRRSALVIARALGRHAGERGGDRPESVAATGGLCIVTPSCRPRDLPSKLGLGASHLRHLGAVLLFYDLNFCSFLFGCLQNSPRGASAVCRSKSRKYQFGNPARPHKDLPSIWPHEQMKARARPLHYVRWQQERGHESWATGAGLARPAPLQRERVALSAEGQMRWRLLRGL